MNGLDSSSKTNGKASSIVANGFEAVGVYLRADRCSLAMISELKTASLRVWSIYEKGYPTTDSYFSRKKGASDGAAAATFASLMKQPAHSVIYFTVDYDADGSNPAGPTINGLISDYARAFQEVIAVSGFVTGVYGSGRTCRILSSNGLAKHGWLTQSKGFAEYASYKAGAGIVQLPRINNSWDGDDIPDPLVAGLW